jgi:hypothetical protein
MIEVVKNTQKRRLLAHIVIIMFHLANLNQRSSAAVPFVHLLDRHKLAIRRGGQDALLRSRPVSLQRNMIRYELPEATEQQGNITEL